jgi:hypothetical protein
MVAGPHPSSEDLVVPLLVFGLPTHVLLVHAVVVLVPLAVLGSVTIAVWPAARRRYGWPAVAVTAAATVSVPLATEAGEALEHALPRSPAIATHAHLGDELLPFVLILLLSTVALMVLDRAGRSLRTRREIDPASAPGTVRERPVPSTAVRLGVVVTALLTVATAAICAVQVVRIGDSGTRAAWGGQVYLQQTGQDED